MGANNVNEYKYFLGGVIYEHLRGTKIWIL